MFRLCGTSIGSRLRGGVLVSTLERQATMPMVARCLASASDGHNSVPTNKFLQEAEGVKSTMTKIVCTIGPSTDKEGPVSQLVAGGMHVARLNFSHAGDDYSYPESNIGLVRNAPGLHAELADGATMEMPKNLRAVLVDTKGKIRSMEIGDRMIGMGMAKPGTSYARSVCPYATILLDVVQLCPLSPPQMNENKVTRETLFAYRPFLITC
mmetsp:Transcript_36196/g.78763  ORF Transcript_36196/g.78763 Transcript_36196/m.78763 type:complete len:210 (+) Transcript_36196:135-764(+)